MQLNKENAPLYGGEKRHKKNTYLKPTVVASYSKQSLREEFKELRGTTTYVDILPGP